MPDDGTTGAGHVPSALVVTVVHRPDDARIRQRQIAALLAHGWRVTYAAAFDGHGVVPADAPGLTSVVLPRAAGRRRLTALRAARRLLVAEAPRHDVVVLHDPELLLATVRLPSGSAPVVWDVHEDTAAALATKAWVPRPLRRPAAAGVRVAERAAERRVHLLLAETAYAERFRRPHPVVPNLSPVPGTTPAPDVPRAVYVGHLTRARGVAEMLEVARSVRADGIRVELVGHADAESTALIERAVAAGEVTWHGFLPLAQAMTVVDGSYAGLSLLHDLPNYRHSQPSKVIDYLAHGVPVVTTPLPLARELVERSGGGIVVPHADSAAAADALRRLADDPALRRRLGAAGHSYARDHLDWGRAAEGFVAALADVAASGAAPAGSSAGSPPPTSGA